MSSHRDKHSRASRRGLVAAMLAVGALLVVASPALAGQDDLKGGSVVLKLQKSHGLKLKPANVTFAITGGAVDPVDGSGPVQVSGSVKARRGKGKTKIKFTTFTLGASGGQGTIVAKVGKDFVNGFGTLTGGRVTRDGWGARIENVSAKISAKGARALNRALSGTKGKGASKSAKGGVKAGQPLGTIASITTVPLDVQVVPGTGQMVLHTQAVPPGPFVNKLSQHCVDPLLTGSPAGVAPIAPATAGGPGGAEYTFPVTNGSIAPDFSAGELFTGGGQTITKNTSILIPSACSTSQPPTGAQLKSTDLSITFVQNSLRSIATLPSGILLPRAPLADIDFSTGTRTVDPSTKSVTITGATVKISSLAAPLLNQTFPTESGNASDDFAAGDLIGTIDVTGVQLR
jgi:hypothetical protein